jgi:hypothetical protein
MRKTRSTILSSSLLAAFALGASALAAAPAMAASPASDGDIQAQYRQDVARCKAGQTNQDEATCLREAGAALEEARRNRLTNHGGSFEQNQVARCQSLPAAERDDCMLQMSGKDTTVQGSVGAGGVLRETTITVPAPAQTTGTMPSAVPGAMPNAVPSAPPVTPAPGLTPNPPPVVPAPSLAPTPAPGTGVGK